MLFSRSIHRLCSGAQIAFVSSACILPPTQALAYKHIDPKEFSVEQSANILRNLGANESLLRVNRVAAAKMEEILESSMVQGMATGTLSKDEWDRKYMRADAIYIYNLGKALAERAKVESGDDRLNVTEFAEMFLGYGKHFERLKKYGLSPSDTLNCSECDEHIELLSKCTSMNEFYLAILTDMIPYVIFSNYILRSIEPSDNNPWMEYAQKYGDLNNKYAKQKLGKTIQIANEILMTGDVSREKAEELFHHGFAFEGWFIKNAFTKGFDIQSSANIQITE